MTPDIPLTPPSALPLHPRLSTPSRPVFPSTPLTTHLPPTSSPPQPPSTTPLPTPATRQYLCSSNHWPTEPPSPPSPPAASHGASCTENRQAFGSAEGWQNIHIDGSSVRVYCIDDPESYRSVDVVPVDYGILTQRIDDPTSCPPGTAIWVPRTQELLNKTYSLFPTQARTRLR